MPLWYPSKEDFSASPSHSTETQILRRNGALASNLYPIMSVSERADKLAEEASHNLTEASAKAQLKVGNIKLYSLKYYTACTLGGLLACVSHLMSNVADLLTQYK